jgi:hypothetical protein
MLKRNQIDIPCLTKGWGKSVNNTYVVKIFFHSEDRHKYNPEYNFITELQWNVLKKN